MFRGPCRIDRVGAGLTPALPTPPDVRVRIRRFAWHPGGGGRVRRTLAGRGRSSRRWAGPVEEAIRSHRFLDSLAAGAVTRERLRAIAGEQRRIVASDRRSFAQLAARFPSPPAGDWFLAMAVGEGEALALLDGYAAWLAIDEDWLREYAPDPRGRG